MDQQELFNKLTQIEEQAQYTLDEFPRTLTKERLRMIIALCRYLRTEVATTGLPQPERPTGDSEATPRLRA